MMLILRTLSLIISLILVLLLVVSRREASRSWEEAQVPVRVKDE